MLCRVVLSVGDPESEIVRVSFRVRVIIIIIFIIKLYFQAHMQTITKTQRTHSIALHSWAI